MVTVRLKVTLLADVRSVSEIEKVFVDSPGDSA